MGAAAISWVVLTKLTDVAAVPPKETVAPETKLDPLMVTEVPPPVVPPIGLTDEIDGGRSYVKPFADVTLWPSGFATVTLTAPAAWAGVTAVSWVALTKVTA